MSTDDRSPDHRSKTMAAIKSKGTRFEITFIEALMEAGAIGIELHPDDIYGKPDIVNRGKCIAVFLDSCFWHGCLEHCRMPNSNRSYWVKKIKRNRERDIQVNRNLKRGGWTVKRIWEHSLKKPATFKWWVTRIRNLSNS